MKTEKEKPPVSIPYFAHEGDMYRLDRINKRQTLAMLCSFALSALLIVSHFRQRG